MCFLIGIREIMNFGMEALARRIIFQFTGNRLRVNCGILWGAAWEVIKVLKYLTKISANFIKYCMIRRNEVKLFYLFENKYLCIFKILNISKIQIIFNTFDSSLRLLIVNESW